MQKFIHLSLIVAILWASMGFRVNVPHCSGEKGSLISFTSDSACCCKKTKKSSKKPCPDMSCAVQQGEVSPTTVNSATQQAAKLIKEPVNSPVLIVSIRPAILVEMPFFTLPPPVSGRYIGILHQTFII